MSRGTTGATGANSAAASDEGGRNALAGYLYQLLGVMGLQALARVDDTPNELTSELELIRTGHLTHEALGQDAVITGGLAAAHDQILVQFKYSRTAPPSSIGQSDLYAIADRLYTSKRAAAATGAQSTGFLLVTNRSLGPSANSMIQAAQSGAPHALLGDTPRHRCRQRSVLKAIRIVAVSQEAWETHLRAVAHRYGVLPLEFDGKRFELVGRLITATTTTATGVPVSISLLKEVFRGKGGRQG
jgi:hypothetical protein